MPKNVNLSKEHFRIILFYRRSFEVQCFTEQQARAWLAARALTSSACHYAELWKMHNEDDGEQIGIFECSNIELIRK